MALRHRRPISSFNLAFLDIMFCGFGAVVLLVLIVHANTLSHRKQQLEDLTAEAERAALTVKAESEHLTEMKAELAQKKQLLAKSRQELASVRQQTQAEEKRLAAQLQQASTDRRKLEQAQKALKVLDTERRQLDKREVQSSASEGQVRHFAGQGRRQYLTGLQLGGRRIALLVDVSASMLDETVVNVLRRRNMSKDVQRNSRKWQQAQKTVAWLLANMPQGADTQILAFNTVPVRLGNDDWVAVGNRQAVDTMVEKLQTMVPAGGTHLTKAFAALAALNPAPDNCILLTDGLPTQGNRGATSGAVSGKKRMSFYKEAIQKLPANIPVNTILFPMEGDPLAATLFWELAVKTNGSFLTPTRDWP
ncbi:hypothetical protein [Desulfogranum marinum]|uniref:hypothetical protein n=1 Tax=Desulfogranum marinum TaxID=453220 RepID=UPI0029C6CD36|nr:hypothetical protein [Desulfogranum marinum]